MKIYKEVHRKLMSFIDGILPDFKNVARSYGISIFKKTRFASHLDFLRTCLRKKVIPKGLTVTSGDNRHFAGHLKRRIQKANLSFSRELIRANIEHFVTCLEEADSQIISAKESLKEIDDQVCSRLRRLVFELNKELYHSLKDTKERKLKALLPVSAPVVPSERTVVTIPEDLHLTEIERTVLSKGLNFIPTPKSEDKNATLQDLESFFRRLKLHAHFNDHNKVVCNEDSASDNLFDKFKTHKSSWVPPIAIPAIDNFISRCKEEVRSLNFRTHSSIGNHSQEEKKALISLQERQDVVIKRADKGGAVVVWQKELYITEAERQLSDETFYEKKSEDCTKDINDMVEFVIKQEIEEGRLPNEAVHLIESNPRCGRFYLLPKIHKTGNPGRPVVSTCSFPTSIVSKFLDEQFQPLVRSLPSYVKDTNHMLTIVKDFQFPIGSNPLLFTMDVKSLYTVIPNDEGLRALKYFLDRREVQEPPTCTLLLLAELVLSNNHFEFNGDHYTQKQGVAMGTKMGPSYANLFMGYVEEMFMIQYQDNKPSLFKRYIDDIFGATTMTKNDLLSFIDHFNSFNAAIEFTHDISDTAIPFLDVCFKLDSDTGRIESTIHYKETDSHAYLQYDSHHPINCKNSIPFSQFLRLRRICSDKINFLEEVEIMTDFFKKRGYPDNVINSAKERIFNITREDALTPNPKNQRSIKLPVVLTYNSNNQKIAAIIKKNAKFLAQDNEVGNLFTDNILMAYRNPPSLARLLVRSKLSTEELPGTFQCGRPRCKTCVSVRNFDIIFGPSGNFEIRNCFTCTSKGLVYCIICLKCSALYIGETERMLSERFREHVSSVRNDRDLEVAKHFNSLGHSAEDMGVMGLVYQSQTCKRRLLEAKIIEKLGTLVPFGLNREEDSSWK